MNTLVAFTFCIIAVSASPIGIDLVGPGTHGAVLQGPSAKATLIGPDGSHIAGGVHGGTVVAPPQHGGVVSAAIEHGYVAHAAPAYAVATHGVVAVPHAAVYGIHHGIAHHDAHLGIESGQPLIGVGSGHEGQWVPDYNEHLYDDGSYKGDHYDEHY